ncbi:rna recognition motif domain containing partial [Plasmopara halstedii]|uniref:Rna recognition motif domain containing partial n=1 Tax=Plasmopara halstedii TaxID=4781 RepID=A0A0P1AKP5_PLAHL|nr:rna recognition motif domain containing partial [Plasmopara halstedii]CEG41850.1 rna recognition motif domain containing partial [Plasmopara halstedii]
MDAERERIERARAKNLAYIREQDELKATQATNSFTDKGSAPGPKGSKGNNSLYITGLTTYMACRQLEGVCNKLGKVRRIKFYKDDKGGLKGDAVVTFHSHVTMLKAVDRLNQFEVKPGVVITATEATFSKKKLKENHSVAVECAQGIQTPVTILPLQTDTSEADSSHLDLPSRSIILHHVWDPLTDSDAAFFDELEEDMRSECSKRGAVEHVHIVANGSVIVRFTELKAAIACIKELNGRWFAGRQIEAKFDQSTIENPSDADTKVEAFLAVLGE